MAAGAAALRRALATALVCRMGALERAARPTDGQAAADAIEALL